MDTCISVLGQHRDPSSLSKCGERGTPADWRACGYSGLWHLSRIMNFWDSTHVANRCFINAF